MSQPQKDCSGCGVPLKPNSKFCFGCGQKVGAPAAGGGAESGPPAAPEPAPASEPKPKPISRAPSAANVGAGGPPRAAGGPPAPGSPTAKAQRPPQDGATPGSPKGTRGPDSFPAASSSPPASSPSSPALKPFKATAEGQPAVAAKDPFAPPNLVSQAAARKEASSQRAADAQQRMANMVGGGQGSRMCGTCGKTVYDAEEVKFRHLVFHKGGCFVCHYAQCEVRTLTLGKAIESMGKVYCSNTCASLDQNLEIIGGGGPKKEVKKLDDGPPCAECGKPCGSQFVKLGGKNYHKSCIGDRLPKCARCGEPATGRILKLEDQRYHAECFTCCNCQTQLATYVMLGESLYCEACADKAPATAAEIKESAGGRPSALTKRSTKKALKSTKAPNEALTLPMPAPGAPMIEGSHKEGYLKKKGGKMGALALPKERYFVLLDKKLEYYEADAKGGLMCRTGAMPLFNCCVVQPNEQDRKKFVISPNTAEAAKTYQLEAPSIEEAQSWIAAIQARTDKAPSRVGYGIPAPAVGSKMNDASFKEGFLRKRGGTLKTWSTRYFVLTNKKVEYYEFDKETKLMYKTGELNLGAHSIVEVDVKDIKNFFVNSHESVTSKLYMLGAMHPQDAEDWMQAIKAQCK